MQTEIHFNVPQIRSMIVNAPEEWGVMARGTGKTKGIIAPKSTQYLNMMPRCVGVFVAATFTQLLTRTLPPVVAGWERMGYKHGVHFLIGQKPSPKWREMWDWQGPYHMPFNYEYFISWWNGAGVQMISQDRAGSSNGVSIDWIMGDEAKLLNEQRLKEELFPANRGIYRELAGNPHHHGKTFTTDMPVGTAGRWILKKEAEMDRERLAAIVTLEDRIFELQQLVPNRRNALPETPQTTIANYRKLLNLLRRGFVYYHEATALDNIAALGIDYIKEERRSLSHFEFGTSIMNVKPYKVEDGFYPCLDEELHGYFSYDYHLIDNIGYNFDMLSRLDDCRKDGDLCKGEPLHIAFDFNRRIWPVVTGQPVKHPGGITELRTLSSLHVLYPQQLDDLLDKWSNYYKPHDSDIVYFWYDHTALGETRTPVRDDIINGLRARGWTVIEMYIGKQPLHDTRYRWAADVMREDGKVPWRVRFNRDNCKYLLLSMFQTKSEEKSTGYGKDKKPERDLKFPAEEAPHFGDAWDTLMVGVIYSELHYDEAKRDFYDFEIR